MSCEQRCINGAYLYVAGYKHSFENVSTVGILIDGGYAEFVTLRSEAIVTVPADLDPAQVAPLLCAGASCFGA